MLSRRTPLETRVFAVFGAPDSTTNVHITLERYSDQVKELKWRYKLVHVHVVHADVCAKDVMGFSFRGKMIRIFPSGNYQFLCLLYGMSGASRMGMEDEGNFRHHACLLHIRCNTIACGVLYRQ